MAKELSQFDKWFKLQFGYLPRNFRPSYEILQDIECAEHNLKRFKDELALSERILELYTATRYAKHAAENKFDY